MNQQEREDRIVELVTRYLKNELTTDEMAEFYTWLAEDDRNQEFVDSLTPEFLAKELAVFDSIDSEKAFERFREEVGLRNARRRWYRVAMIASVLILVSVSGYFWLTSKPRTANKELASKGTVTQPLTDIPAGTSKAILTLGNGKTVLLDSLNNGVIARENGSELIKTAGQLTYDAAHQPEEKIAYNTVSTPRGGEFKVRLPDGTVAWLNAASSIRFPTVFNGSERAVAITGEVYFEVTKDKNKPFIVNTSNSAIRVLGTHFNVNEYAENGAVTTTLLEGSVQVSRGTDTKIIKPGEQASVQEKKISVQKVDLDEVMAWRQNKMSFKSINIREVMQQVGRWYDVDVSFDPTKKVDESIEITAVISRDIPLSTLLSSLEKTGYMHFERKGRIVTVKQ